MNIQQELYRTAIENARAWLAEPRTIILDTETTSLNGYLVELAAINVAGDVLLNTLVNPQASIDRRAAAVHGHTAASLAGAPVFADIVEQLLAVISGKRVVIYNSSFDVNILRNELRRSIMNDDLAVERSLLNEMPHLFETAMYSRPRIPQVRLVEERIDAIMSQSTWECAMLAYSDWCGDWNDYHGNNRWQRLPGGDHTALGDCRATLKVLRKIAATAVTDRSPQ